MAKVITRKEFLKYIGLQARVMGFLGKKIKVSKASKDIFSKTMRQRSSGSGLSRGFTIQQTVQ